MSHPIHRRRARLLVAAVAALAVPSACDRPDAAPLEPESPALTPSHAAHARADVANPEIATWLAGLRAATAPFHRLDAAMAAGWDARITDCFELPGTGGMGFHYANGSLIDGTPEEFAPELLVYAPREKGGLGLVAVEYIVPFDAWTGEDPPELHGVSFHRNEAFGIWVLHAWVWKNNPKGIFMDWNPKVSCAAA